MVIENLNPKTRLGISLITCTLLVLLALTRELDFGTDLIGYNNSFLRLSNMSWKETFEVFNFQTVNEPVFYFLTKIIGDLGINFSIYLAIILGISLSLTHTVIKKYSSLVGLSYLIYISLGYYFFNLNGIRQSLAIGIVLYSLHFLISKKPWKFIFVILTASLFHVSALVFLVLAITRKVKISFRTLIISFTFLLLIFVFSNQIVTFLLGISFIQKYSYYLNSGVGLNYTNLIIHFTIFVFIYTVLIHDNYNEMNNIITQSLIMGLGFLILSTVVAESFRLALYFNIITVIAIPVAIEKIKKRNVRTYIFVGILFLLILYTYVSNIYFELGL